MSGFNAFPNFFNPVIGLGIFNFSLPVIISVSFESVFNLNDLFFFRQLKYSAESLPSFLKPGKSLQECSLAFI